MADHDPLCPIASRPKNATLICECFFIGKARADERERIAQAIEAVDPVEWALWGQHGGVYAARIARNGGSDD